MRLHIHIKDISYKYKGTNVIKCIIHWENPLTGNIQKSIGITRRNPNDVNNITLGKRIAEGRAKMTMWRDFENSVRLFHHNTIRRYGNLIDHEIKHVHDLINNNN